MGGMRETKVTQLGSDAPFQKVSSPGRRLGNREKKKLEIQTHGATDTGQQLSIVAQQTTPLPASIPPHVMA